MQKMSTLLLMLHGVILVIVTYVPAANSKCNEAVCASIVSKCLLTQSCKCDLKNCTCCKDCYNCLDDLYDVCCPCVEMCQTSNYTDDLGKSSQIGDLVNKIPQLFSALTEEQDASKRWLAYSYPTYKDILPEDINFITTASPSQDIGKQEGEPVNCTVAFMSQCTSADKCRVSCGSMGASSYRWFFDGCCECVGDTCLNYGMNTNKCLDCPQEFDHGVDESDAMEDDSSEVESNETGDTDAKKSSSNADKNDAKKQTKEQADAKEA